MTTTMQIAQYGSLDDLLFRGKNKNYGAYELRQAYEHRLRRALILFFGSVLSIIIIAQSYERWIGNYIIVNTDPPIDGRIYDPTEMTNVVIDKPKIDLPQAQQDISTIMNVAPTIVDNPPATDDKTMKDILDSDLQSGVNDHTGTDIGQPSPDPVVAGSNLGTSDLANDFDPNTIYDIVTDDPQFPGDLSKFLSERAKFPPICEELGYTKGTVVVGFVVNEDGKISNIKLEKSDHESFNEQALKAVRAMPRWIPGSNNGHKVKVNMSIPFNFVLDN